MRYYEIAVLQRGQRSNQAFTYHCNENLQNGSLVRVEFARKKVNGVIISQTTKPKFNTKPIENLKQQPIPQALLTLAQWLSDYYCVGLSSALAIMLPAGLHKKRRTYKSKQNLIERQSHHDIPLTEDQKTVLEAITKHSTKSPILLHGVTGSGKTRVYLELAKECLSKGQSAVILVPEITLTPQMVGEFQNIHDNVATFHSQLTESERHSLWQRVRNSDQPIVVIGPRSALFAPLNNIGLIVVDECHEASYKQDQQPKYDALLAASQLANIHGSQIIFGSATPSVTTYTFAQLKKWLVVEINKPAVAQKRTIVCIDQSAKQNFTKNLYFSNQLLSAIKDSINHQQQSLIFYNRRGSARSLQCQNCGWMLTCPNCNIPMILHHDEHKMRCHLCGIIKDIPSSCPDCQSSELKFSGFGTKRLEAELNKLFPHATIKRFDNDTPRIDSLLNKYQDVHDGKVDILLGTQMLTKGLDLPKLSVLGVIHADSGLQLPDVFAAERNFQILYQAIGRIGRQGLPARAIIQTYQPEQPAIKAALTQDYQQFYKYELKEREELYYPPRCFIMTVTAGYSTALSAESKLSQWTKDIRKAHPRINILGPAPAFHEHIAGKHRAQLVIRSASRKTLQSIVTKVPPNWQFELDPISLL